jgi:hypothetical protein
MGKMFTYIPLKPKDGVFRADLKCNPEKSIFATTCAEIRILTENAKN